MFREDGSYNSANNPVAKHRYMVEDFGFYKAQILDALYSDDPTNPTSQTNSPETLYKVRIIGGKRDGQVFTNATDMRLYGGISNNSERGWKRTKTLVSLDVASLYNPTAEPTNALNGDVVYIQFINGDIHYPVILGGAKHEADTTSDSGITDGQIYSSTFNGISTNIDKDGVFTWSKAKGAYSPIPLPNANGDLVWDQFVSLVGLDQAFLVTADNNLKLALSINPTPATSISVEVDGLSDSFTFTNIVGHSLALSATGGFSVSLQTGSKLSVGIDGSISIKNATGNSINMSAVGEITIKNTIGGQLSIAPTGFIKLGNSTGDALQILKTLIQSLSTATYAGFGAPGSNVADLIQLLTKITLITG